MVDFVILKSTPIRHMAHESIYKGPDTYKFDPLVIL
jgi:hypothetical protein